MHSLMKDIGMQYQKIDPYLNDYMIYFLEGKKSLRNSPILKLVDITLIKR